MNKLLSVNADVKTKKGTKLGVLTGILYLAPHTVSGYQTCPKSTAGCRAGCLFTAGMAMIYPEMINGARIKRTKLFFEERAKFFHTLVKDIERLIAKAKKDNMDVAVRLNGTSDIAWEKFKIIRNNEIFANIFDAFPEVEYYDYTKISKRKIAHIPNYHLTFSLAEDNDNDAVAALNNGISVSVVLNVTRTKPLPETWGGYPMIDGDVSDVRYKDAKAIIVGLRAKGAARKDTFGFVRTVDSGFNV